VEFGQRPGQAAGRRAFHRADAQAPARALRRHCGARLLHQVENAFGIVEQGLAGGRQHHAAAVAHEQRHAYRFLQLLDARGDVGLHAVEPLGRPRDAAFGHHGAEYFQFGQFHDDLHSR
jgi:hypothetical protein